jgi:hypothetical protein
MYTGRFLAFGQKFCQHLARDPIFHPRLDAFVSLYAKALPMSWFHHVIFQNEARLWLVLVISDGGRPQLLRKYFRRDKFWLMTEKQPSILDTVCKLAKRCRANTGLACTSEDLSKQTVCHPGRVGDSKPRCEIVIACGRHGLRNPRIAGEDPSSRSVRKSLRLLAGNESLNSSLNVVPGLSGLPAQAVIQAVAHSMAARVGREVHSGTALLAHCAIDSGGGQVGYCIRHWRGLGRSRLGRSGYFALPRSLPLESGASHFHPGRNDAWRSFSPCAFAGCIPRVHRAHWSSACRASRGSRRRGPPCHGVNGQPVHSCHIDHHQANSSDDHLVIEPAVRTPASRVDAHRERRAATGVSTSSRLAQRRGQLVLPPSPTALQDSLPRSPVDRTDRTGPAALRFNPHSPAWAAYCKSPYRERSGSGLPRSSGSLCRSARDTALMTYRQVSG